MRVKSTLTAAVAAAVLVAAPAAQAGPGSGPTASVSLGDSFISGEAGRWQGNSNNQFGSRSGTDRAWVSTWYGGYYDTNRVYLGGSAANGCHRSDVAEVRTATVPVSEKINLSCSGAQTVNVFRAASGGQGQNGEAPQADQLATVAGQKDVKLVVLSIGGNDLGFSSIIAACVTNWTTSPSWAPNYCYDEQQPNVDARMPAARANVAKAIDEVRAVMSGAGYAQSQYRLLLQSYPSPVSRAAENRYPESGWSRLDTGGCPFWNRDLDWARDSLVAQIASNLRSVASSKGVQFLELRDSMQGREVCSRATSLATGSNPPSQTRSEWMRFLVSGIGQGDLQESFHPNAYAQRALGRCLTLIYGQATGDFACRNTAGQGYASMTLSALAPAAAARTQSAAPETTAAAPVAAPKWPPAYPSRARRDGRGPR